MLCKKGRQELSSVGTGADPGVQTVTPPQVTLSDPLGGRLPLLFVRLVLTSATPCRPATNLCYMVTEAHRCELLAQSW